jgi:thioredoxin 1
MMYPVLCTFACLVSVPTLMAWPSAEQKKTAVPVETVVPVQVQTKQVVPATNNVPVENNFFELTGATQFTGLMSSDKTVVVDFYAVWCEPCKVFGPIFEKVAAEYSDIIFVKVDVEKFNTIASQKGITSMPTLAVYKNGKQVYKKAGAPRSAAEFRKMLQGLGL